MIPTRGKKCGGRSGLPAAVTNRSISRLDSADRRRNGTAAGGQRASVTRLVTAAELRSWVLAQQLLREHGTPGIAPEHVTVTLRCWGCAA